MAAAPSFTDVIVVVHGIGEQIRFSTVRYVATRLAGSKALLAGAGILPVAPQPLGYFHSDVRGITSVSLVDDPTSLAQMPLGSIGFSEVFWADIPEKVVKEGDTLEETKAWARTVVARARALCLRAQSRNSDIVPPDFSLAAEVLDEVIETVYVLENLFFLADKAGLFKFNLRQLLEDYLGDVQIVTEFSCYRADIVGRFHRAMDDIFEMQRAAGNDQVRLHIVAHSEGTVVSFLGLLYAMSGTRLIPAGPVGQTAPQLKQEKLAPDWLSRVHGFMTIGSPLDKHLLLWPRLWNALEPSFADGLLAPGQIKWRNYYDYGDPIGFRLDTTRRWLDLHKLKAFEFCGCPDCGHDMGFARYLLPGKAHNDYWEDPAVFEHFVDQVITPARMGVPRPADRLAVLWISPALPYLLSFLALFLGVYLLYKGGSRFNFPVSDPLEQALVYASIGVRLTPEEPASVVLLNVLGISALLAGATLFARFPRLAATLRWKLWGVLAFLLGAIFYALLVSPATRASAGALFGREHPRASTLGVVLLALLVGCLGFLMTRPGRQRGEDRRQRWFLKGTRPLIVSGALAVALLVGSEIYPGAFGMGTRLSPARRAQLSADQAGIVESSVLTPPELDQLFRSPENLRGLARVEPILTRRPPVWPALLATAGFLYLWWLATLIFDLAFVWQRYVRRSVVNDRLSEWESFGLAPKGEAGKPEPCRKRGGESPAEL